MLYIYTKENTEFSSVHTGAQAKTALLPSVKHTHTHANKHTYKYSKNIFEKLVEEEDTQFYPTLSEIVVLNYQGVVKQLCVCAQSVVAAF